VHHPQQIERAATLVCVGERLADGRYDVLELIAL
jgi:hypothetical protein